MSNRKKNQGKKTAPKFTSIVEHLDGSRTVTTYPTYDRLIAATFESVTAKTRAFNALTKEPPAKVKTKRVTSWNGYVYGAIGMAEQDQFAADIRKPGADIEALKAAMVDRAVPLEG